MIEKDGYQSVAETLVRDDMNVFGLRGKSSEYQTKVVELLMASDFEKIVKEAFAKATEADAERETEANTGEVNQAKAEQQAEKIMTIVRTLNSWPVAAVQMAWK